jgi:hypothetical protein
MSRIIKSLIILGLLFQLNACVTISTLSEPIESPTPWVEGTENALGSPTAPAASISPSLIPFAVLPLASSPTPLSMPPDFSPILYGKKYDGNTFFLVLGGLLGKVWLVSNHAAVQFGDVPASEYDVYTLAKSRFQVRGDPPAFSPPYRIYTVGTDVTVDEPGMVAVIRGWPVLQRDIRELDTNHELYRQMVVDWLAAQGVADPRLGSFHIFRVDLEGDGVDEIFISATHLDESQHMSRAGDYSVILMRRVAGNEAVTLLILGDIYTSAEPELTYPRTYSIANFIDLNRDGRLEVIVDIMRWEGSGAAVYEIDGQTVMEALRTE